MHVTDTHIVGDLIEMLDSGRKRYQYLAECLRENGSPKIAGRLMELSEQRGRFSTELRELAAHGGSTPGESGSSVATVDGGWLGLNDALAGEDAAVALSEAEAAEGFARVAFQAAVEESNFREDLRKVISRQAIEIGATHREVRVLRDQVNGSKR